jgi:FlaG/FlaF family flagellin (archaellin)
MVAITVILAAVIASFVLGLGDSTDNTQPNTAFGFDYSNPSSGTPIITATLTDGDTIEAQEIVFRGEQIGACDGNSLDAPGACTSIPSSNEWNAGESLDLDISGAGSPDEHVLNIVWEDADGDNQATLETTEGPDA